MAAEIPDPEEWTPPEEELWTLWLIVDVGRGEKQCIYKSRERKPPTAEWSLG